MSTFRIGDEGCSCASDFIFLHIFVCLVVPSGEIQGKDEPASIVGHKVVVC